MSDVPIIDQEALNALRALNPDDGDAFLREIIAIYLEDTPLRIAELESSAAANDAATFTRAAHSIKGSSANLGATVLKDAAGKLEHDSKSASLDSLAPLVAQVREEFARAEAELKKHLG